MQTQCKKLKILILLLLALFTATVAAATVTTTNPTDELAYLLNNIHTMQATFTQSLINQHNQRTGTITVGSMMCERPGKFRWEITKPNNQLIIINNDKMFLYDADLSQLTKRHVNYRQPGNPAILLSSPTESLKLSFQIIKLKKSGQGSWFKLIPKKQKHQTPAYQWIKIHFSNEQLDAMYIFDNLEQTSLISFNNIILNTKISSKQFTFTPPPNTEVFEPE